VKKNRHKEHAKKREAGGFVALPHAVLRSQELAQLSPFGVKALVDLLSQYRGDNNGDFCAAWKIMAERGWRSRDSLAKALSELRETGFLVVTRQGLAGGMAKGTRRVATLYAVTFYEVDYCGGKLDIAAPTRAHLGAWRRLANVVSFKPVAKPLPKPPKPALSVTRPPCQFPAECPGERVNALALT
jgi:hypothetical protein